MVCGVDVVLRTYTKKASCVEEEIGLCAQNLVTILSLITNIIEGTYMIIYEEKHSSFL